MIHRLLFSLGYMTNWEVDKRLYYKAVFWLHLASITLVIRRLLQDLSVFLLRLSAVLGDATNRIIAKAERISDERAELRRGDR